MYVKCVLSMKVRQLLFFLCWFISSFLFAQNKHLSKAESSYNDLAYNKAIKLYDKYILKSGDSTVLNKLAFSYYKIGDYKRAYEKYNAWELQSDFNLSSFSIEELYQYAIAANSSNEKDKYDSLISVFSSRYPTDSRATFHKRRKLADTFLAKFNTQYKITPFALNSKYSDFGFYTQADNAFFVSKRLKNGSDSWSGKYFSSLFTYNSNNSSTSSPIKFKIRNNDLAHHSSSVLNKAGTEIYVTQSVPNKSGNLFLNIIKYHYDQGVLSDPESLSINGADYNTAHPSINYKENTLYFSSDRPGGYGLSDLYQVEMKSDGSLGDPVNLGPKINTASRESFPFIDQENYLYFASDGHPTYGGLDIFGIALDDPYAIVLNLGKPLNDIQDDFGYYSSNGKAYFSSNREGGLGSDDIYEVLIENPIVLDCFGSISGLVINEFTGKPIENAVIEVLKNKIQVTTTQTSANGFYSIENLDCGEQFTLRISHQNYEEASKQIQISRLYDHSKISTVALSQKNSFEDKLETITNNANSKSNEILYGFDKIEYLPQGEVLIKELAELLIQTPDKNIVIESYTDPSGPEKYNQWLSQERSNFIKNRLIQLGVDESQLISIGKGEFRNNRDCPTNNCEYDRNRQRRTDFKIFNDDEVKYNQKKKEDLNVEDLVFSFNSVFFLKNEANKTLDKVASYLFENTDIVVTLTGHSDSVGPDQFNLILSNKRAEHVKSLLIKRGIDSNRIKTRGMGETQPKIKCDSQSSCTIQDHRKNRRLEFKFHE